MMMRVKETARIGFTSLLLSAALLVASGFAIGVVGPVDRVAHHAPLSCEPPWKRSTGALAEKRGSGALAKLVRDFVDLE